MANATEEGDRKALEAARMLRRLLPLEARGRAGQKVEVAVLDPDHDMRAKGVVRITVFEARMLRDRLVKEAERITEIIERLDRENGLIT